MNALDDCLQKNVPDEQKQGEYRDQILSLVEGKQSLDNVIAALEVAVERTQSLVDNSAQAISNANADAREAAAKPVQPVPAAAKPAKPAKPSKPAATPVEPAAKPAQWGAPSASEVSEGVETALEFGGYRFLFGKVASQWEVMLRGMGDLKGKKFTVRYYGDRRSNILYPDSPNWPDVIPPALKQALITYSAAKNDAEVIAAQSELERVVSDINGEKPASTTPVRPRRRARKAAAPEAEPVVPVAPVDPAIAAEADAVEENTKRILKTISEGFMVGDLVRFGNNPGVVIGVEGDYVRFRPDSARSPKAYQRVPKSSLTMIARPDSGGMSSYSREQDKKFGEEKGQLGVDMPRLLTNLGQNMYGAALADVAIKELLQNAFDAVKGATAKVNAKGKKIQPLYEYGSIKIDINADTREITISDNARGMTPEIVRKAFFTVSGSDKSDLPPSMRSGGLGLAKVGFMLGTERLILDTVRDGVRVRVDASAKEIAGSKFKVNKSPAPADEHGTTVTVKIPKTFIDKNGEEQWMYFPHEIDSSQTLERPLIGPAEILITHKAYGKETNKVLPAGINFDESPYIKFKANFDWGSADIYFGINRVTANSSYDVYSKISHQVLSSGVYQFRTEFKSKNEKIPYNIIVDIKSDVEATDADYPFENSRERFKDRMEGEVKALTQYLGQIALGYEARDLQESFKNLVSMPRMEAGKEIADIADKLKKTFGTNVPEKAAVLKPLPQEVTVTKDAVKDSKTNQFLVDIKTQEAEKKKETTFQGEKTPGAADFMIDMKQDPRLPVFHNNTNVDFLEIGRAYGEPERFFAELGTLLVEMKEDMANSGMYGYEKLSPDNLFFAGVSIDKKYGGVHIKVPYKAVFVNPFYDFGARTLFGARQTLLTTMIHEIAHTGSMDHGVAHNTDMVKVAQYLADEGLLDYYSDAILDVLRRHESTFTAMREAYGKSTTSNTAKSLEDYGKESSAASARSDLGGAEYEPGSVRPGEGRGRGAGVQEAEAAGREGEVGGGATKASGISLLNVSPPKMLKPEIVEILGKHRRNLTPEETRKLRRDTARSLVSIIESLPTTQEMAAVAYAGRAKRGWYAGSASAIVNVFGLDAPRFTALLAALSPQTGVEDNLLNTLNVWKNWIAAGRPTTRAEIISVMGRSVQGSKGEKSILDAWINNSVSALSSANPESLVISGPKVNSFMLNLRGVVNEVTNDAWMANFALVDQKIFSGGLNAAGTDPGKGPGYLAMSAQVRGAARKLTALTGETWTPAEVQETIWSWAKTLYESASVSKSAEQIIRNNELRDDLIAATPDFRSLFNDTVNAQILRDAGYAEQLESLRGDNAQEREQVQGAGGQAAPFAATTQKRLEIRAAKRLDELRARRNAESQSSSEVESPFDGPERGNTPLGSLTEIEVDGKKRPTLNSEGRPIYPTQEGVRNFWRWFGKSLVLDNDGRPLVVYHGTSRDFTEFKLGRWPGTLNDIGFWFSNEPSDANAFASADGALVMPVYLRMEKTLYIDSFDMLQRLWKKHAGSETLKNGAESFRAWLRASGYDSVSFDGSDLDPSFARGIYMVVLDSTQIKSVTGNTGDFDPAQESILKNVGPVSQNQPADNNAVEGWMIDAEQRREDMISEYKSLRQKIAAFPRRYARKGATGEADQPDSIKFLLEKAAALRQAIETSKPRRDTPEDFLARAARALADGQISQETFDVIDAAFRKQPELLDGLVLSVRGEKNGVLGSFFAAQRIVALYGSGGFRPETFRHELAHSLEQMMLPEQKKAVFNAWIKALSRAMKQYTDDQSKAYFQAVIDFIASPSDETLKKAVALLPSYDLYQFINPSEYWAVNAENLMAAQLGSSWQRFKMAVRRLFEGLKKVFGFNNKYAVHKTFADIMKGSKERISNNVIVDYVTGLGGRLTTLDNIQPDKDLLEKYKRPNTPTPSEGIAKGYLTDAYRAGKEFFKEAVQDPKQAIVGTGDAVIDGLVAIRTKAVWYGSGVEARDFDKYNGELITSNGLATASLALDNAIRGGNIGVEVTFKGGIKYDPRSKNFVAVNRDKGMKGVYEAEAKLRAKLGKQLGTDIIQGYLEAKRSISIMNELYDREQDYELAKQALGDLKKIGAEPDEIKSAQVEHDQLLRDLQAIKKAVSSVNMSEDEMQEFAALDQRHPELRDIMDNWTAINQNLLRFWRQVGLLSQKRYDTLSDIKDYVPWYRIMSDEEDVHSELQSGTRSLTNIGVEKKFKRGRPVAVVDFRAKAGQKEFKIQPSSVVHIEINGERMSAADMQNLVSVTPSGEVRIDMDLAENDLVVFRTNREIQNIIDNMTRNVMRMTMNGLRQYAANRIVSEYASRDAENKIMTFSRVDRDKGRFNWVVNGKKVVVEIRDPLIAASIYGMDNISLKMWEPLAFVANITRRSITLSGAFQVKQVFKDAPTAAWVTGVRNPLALIGGVWKGFLTSLTNTDPAVDILRAAGIGGFHGPARTPEAEIKRRMGIMNRNVFDFVIKGLDHIGDSSDMAQRVAVYKRVLAETGNEAQAMFQAANVINFLHHGSMGAAQAVIKTVPFFGAWANSIDVFARALVGGGLKGMSRGKALRRMAMTGTLLTSLTILYCMLAGADPEYDELDDQTRLKNIIIPGTKIMLPMNTSAAYFFKAIPEMLYNKIIREGTESAVDRRRLRAALAEAAIDAIVGPEPVPAGIKPVFEVAINRSFFTERSIIPEGLRDVEAAQQYTANTSEIGKILSGMMAIPGTDGKRIVSPIEADYLLRGIFGSAGAMAQWVSNSIGAIAETRPEPTAKEAPLVGSFLRDEVPRGLESLYYDFKKDVGQKYRTYQIFVNRENFDAAEAYLEKHGDIIGMQKYINQTDNELKEINREIRRVGETVEKDLTPKERRSEIDDLRRLRLELLEPVRELRQEVYGTETGIEKVLRRLRQSQ